MSMPEVAPLDINIFRGDGFTASLTITDKNKKKQPLPPGTQISLIVRPNFDRVDDPIADPPILILRDASQTGGDDSQIKITSPNDGQVLINITGSQSDAIEPDTYKYVIRVLLPGAPGPRTVTRGDFTIEPNISA